MPKSTNENNNIKENLEYIGLDLNNIPDFLLEYKEVDFKPSKIIEDNTFKVYRYINLKDIEILLTPKNRLNTISEKYMNAVPLNMYLDSENEENIIRYAELIKMFEHVNVKEIEQIEKEQKKVKQVLDSAHPQWQTILDRMVAGKGSIKALQDYYIISASVEKEITDYLNNHIKKN